MYMRDYELWRPRSPSVCHLQGQESQRSFQSESKGLRTTTADVQGQDLKRRAHLPFLHPLVLSAPSVD